MVGRKTHKYTIDTITDYNSFKHLEHDWNRLAKNHGSIYPFICFEWFDLWFKSFLRRASLHIYVLSDDDGICAIIPLIKHNAFPGAAIKLAANDHSPKAEIISDKNDLPGYIETFVGELLNENVFTLYFEDLLAESESARLILEFLEKNRHGHLYERRFIRESVFVNTEIGWENLRLRLSKKFKKNINNQKNRLAKAGELQFVKFTKPVDLPVAFNCIEKISSKSWQGENGTGLFSREDTKEFYKGLAEFTSRAGWLSIWILYLNGKPLAYEYHLRAESIEYALKAEYDKEYSDLSPGSVLDAHVVRELSEGSAERYDLLGYKEGYKTRWSDTTEKYIRIYVLKRNLIGTVCHFIEFPLRARLKKYALLRDIKNYFLKS